MKWFLAVLACLALAGCGRSPPTQFYVLSPVPPKQTAAVPEVPHVIVSNVNVPASLDRRSVVLRTSADQVEVSEQARWAAPLDGMIRRVLAADLAQRIGRDKVVAPGDPVPPGPSRVVALNLQDFVGSNQGEVTLDGDWSLQDDKHRVLQTRHVHLTRQVEADDVAAIAAAFSDMLGTVSDQIAAALAAS
jgi:uncharacterized protein